MRKNILAAGTTLLALALVYAVSYPQTLFISLPFSILNMILGVVTKTPPGVETQPETGEVKLLIDRGVVRASIYQLVFLNSKLILKRLSSVTVTVVLAGVLAVLGLELLGIIGALMGGVTGFSLQEFLTQRTRNRIGKRMQLTSTGRNDIEIQYNDLSEVRQIGSRLYFIREKGSFTTSFPRGYMKKMLTNLESILKGKFTDEDSFRTAQAAKKKDEKSHHSSSNSR